MRGPLPLLVAGLSLAASCGPSEPTYDTGPLEAEPGASEPEPDAEIDPPSPSWGAAEVQADLDEALSTGFPNLVDATAAYFRLMEQGDVFCPGSDTRITDTWLYGCLADSGVFYMGIAEYALWTGAEAEAEGYATNEVLAGDFVIIDADGRELRVGGGVGWTRYLAEGGDELGSWALEMGGSWLDESRSDWLGEGTSLMVLMGGTEPDQGGELWVSGGVGIGGHDLFFDELRFAPESCDLPAGTVSVRGPDTWWYQVAYPEDCGACAEIRFQDGSVLGESCSDLTELYEAVAAATVGRP